MADGEANTVPIIIGEEKPRTASCLVQTEERLDESNLPIEPKPPQTAEEAVTA